MGKKQNKIDRRNFLKTVGALGVGSAIAFVKTNAEVNEPNTVQKTEEAKLSELPRRKLGKTGIEIPVLANGLMFDAVENSIILRANLQHGVTYWDTADCYAGGSSEVGIGKFLKANPEIRKDLFIVSKSDARDPAGIQKLLERSLERLNTDYIDLYFIHGVGAPAELTDEIKQWVQTAKKQNKIKFFGFSTHANMDNCLFAAVKLGWIDAIMTSYNFRFMQDVKKAPRMQAAVDACHKAGVGLIAMKTQGRGQKVKTEEDKKLIDHFLKSGFTEGQAKIKVVLEDERFSAACVTMDSVALLNLNVAAVLDKTKLSDADVNVLTEYARATCSGYCAGCGNICDRALPGTPYVSEIMRYLMYYNSYGDRDRARELFAQIPAGVRNKLPAADYSVAEAHCPQRLPIAELVTEAVRKLA